MELPLPLAASTQTFSCPPSGSAPVCEWHSHSAGLSRLSLVTPVPVCLDYTRHYNENCMKNTGIMTETWSQWYNSYKIQKQQETLFHCARRARSSRAKQGQAETLETTENEAVHSVHCEVCGENTHRRHSDCRKHHTARFNALS